MELNLRIIVAFKESINVCFILFCSKCLIYTQLANHCKQVHNISGKNSKKRNSLICFIRPIEIFGAIFCTIYNLFSFLRRMQSVISCTSSTILFKSSDSRKMGCGNENRSAFKVMSSTSYSSKKIIALKQKKVTSNEILFYDEKPN